jgi:hypothetical protein
MTHNDHPRLFFLHIQKCAGMTLHAVIERQYAPEQIYTVPSAPWVDQNYQSLCDEWAPDAKAQLRVVKGHMNYGWHNAFPGEPYEYVTILRHPVERVLSLYSFIKDWHRDYQHKEQGIATFARRAVEGCNDMTYVLSGGAGRDARAFIKAWRALTSMAVVGTVETFDQTLQALRARYGWQTEAYDRINATPARLYEISDKVIRTITQRNKYDLMLYAYAQRKQGQNL